MSSHLAKALWKARTEGGVVPLDDGQRPVSADDAYGVQDEVTALFDAERAGWKLGATNQKTLALLGFDRAFMGPLLSQHFHDPQQPVEVYPEHGPKLETEFLVCLAGDLPPRDKAYSDEDVMAAVEYVCPAFEIVGCRVDVAFGAAGLFLIADGAANLAVIPGEPTTDWRSADLSDHPLRVAVNGAEVATGSSSLLMWGNPFAAVAYLASHPQAAEHGLRAGDRIMTGTCGGLIPVEPGDEATADFGVLGSVHLKLASA